jgi:peptide deformylase
MQILTYPNDHLRITTKAVEKVTPELVDIAQEMYKTMREAKGLGLASTQVGLDIALLVLEQQGNPLIMFNPKTMRQSQVKETGIEGCLSFPNEFLDVTRATEVEVIYRDVNNKMQFIKLKGMMARAYLHEHDHLHGKLFIDIAK